MEPAQNTPLKSSLYPTLTISLIQNPNRMYAVPVFGFLIKIIILIPVFIEVGILSIVYGLLSMINSFMVLFTGEYWDSAYTFILGYIRLTTKLYFFMAGLTDKYPGFDFEIHDSFKVDMPKLENPSRLFAFPILGGVIRSILLIPFVIYENIIQSASWIGVMYSSYSVLFRGKYPESTFELYRDYNRVQLASTVYFSGLSDEYPSFWISMNHRTIKVVLIILAILLVVMNMFGSILSSILASSKYGTNNDQNAFPPKSSFPLKTY